MELLREKRAICNVIVPGDKETQARHQQKAYLKYRIALGAALGALGYAVSRGDIEQRAYEDMKTQALTTMIATTTGSF